MALPKIQITKYESERALNIQFKLGNLTNRINGRRGLTSDIEDENDPYYWIEMAYGCMLNAMKVVDKQAEEKGIKEQDTQQKIT